MTRIAVRLADEAATLRFGRQLARATFAAPGPPATAGGMIYLHGELGAGKTTLARGLLRGYGHQGPVKSPTYTLLEPYESAGLRIYHFDLYRLADPREVEYLGAEECFGPGNLCVVEWPERGGDALPAPDLRVRLAAADAGRALDCRGESEKGRAMAAALAEERARGDEDRPIDPDGGGRT